MRVIAPVAVVTENEIIICRYLLLVQMIAGRTADIGLFQSGTVHIDRAVFDLHRVPRLGDDAFDVFPLVAIVWLKNDNIASFRLVHAIGNLAYQDTLAAVKAWLHADAENNDGVNGEAQQEENGQGKYGGDYKLT